MDINESVSLPSQDEHDSSCPFCGGKEDFMLSGYHTKHGALKEESVLGENLKKRDEITRDKKVGNVYPLPGGNKPHEGWVIKEGVFEELAVEVRPTPHHLIPGNASMAPSSLEQWTCASKGEIKEDIGYNIDCAQNGIWLPHLPHIHWTRYMDKVKKLRFSHVFGAWADLPESRRNGVGYVIMGETWLQMHYTDHDDPYAHVDNETTYDDEAKERCNLLGDLVTRFWSPKCPESKDSSDGKHYPPYGLIARINLQSLYMRDRITGRPTWWRSWVSPLAQNFSNALVHDEIPLISKFLVSKK